MSALLVSLGFANILQTTLHLGCGRKMRPVRARQTVFSWDASTEAISCRSAVLTLRMTTVWCRASSSFACGSPAYSVVLLSSLCVT
jgi:hypothetical protein